MEEKKDKAFKKFKYENNILILFIIFLVIIGTLYSIYVQIGKSITIDTTNSNDISVDENEQTIHETNDVTIELVNNLLKMTDLSYGGNENNKYYYNDSFTFKDFSVRDKLTLTSKLSKIYGNEDYCYDEMKCYYTAEEFDKNFVKLFGSNVTNDIKNKCLKADYSDSNECLALGNMYVYKDNKYYNWSVSGAGSGTRNVVYTKLISYNKNGNDIEAIVKYFYYNSKADNSFKGVNVYSKYNNEYNADNSKNLLDFYTVSEDNFKSDEMKKATEEKMYEKYKDKLNSYKYTFKYDKNLDNYYFYSINKVN